MTASVCLAILAGISAGCQTSSRAEIVSARRAFEAGDFDQAYSTAAQVAQSQRDTLRVEAAYIAGLSAYRLDRLSDAERYLQIVAASGKTPISGSALAVLGLGHAARGSYDLASDALARAAEKLDGQDRANAYYYAAIAEMKLHRWADARSYLTLARFASTDEAFRKRATIVLRNTGWTIQIGPYPNEAKAQVAAGRIAARPESRSIGVPRVVKSTDDDGVTSYSVRIGEFSTRLNAANKRRVLGIDNAVITVIGADGTK